MCNTYIYKYICNIYIYINSLLLYIPKFNIDAYEHCFALRAARYWNVLHDNIVLSNSVHSFCNHLLTFDFSVLLRGRAVTRL